ncbi:MAG: hypothetical protein D6739_01815, partial [Nitrospirae bacterium]
GHQVLRITPAGEVSPLAELAGVARAVAVDREDRLYALDSSAGLVRIRPDGTVVPLPAVGLADPQGLTVDADGRLYVVNRDGSVLRVDPGGGSSRVLEGATFEFEGVNLTADCADNLIFAPMALTPFKALGGEEDTLLELVGGTGEVRQVLYGPDLDPALGDMDVLFYDRFGDRLLVWTDRNHGKIFSLPVVCGGMAVEAHLITRPDVTLAAAEPPPTRRLARGDGSVEAVWELAQVDVAGRALDLDLLFHGLAEGERRPAVQAAFLTLADPFDPGTRVTVPLEVPELLASTAMGLTLGLGAGGHPAGEPVAIRVAVANGGDLPFDGELRLAVADASGAPVATLPPIAVTAVAPGATAEVTATWETADLYAGGYTVEARLADTDGREVARAEAALTLAADPSSTGRLAAGLHTDRPRYRPWDTVTLTARVANPAAHALQAAATAEFTVAGPDGAPVAGATLPVRPLGPGDHADLGHTVALADAAAGGYTARLTVRDAAGATLAQAEARFRVERTAASPLSGHVAVALPQVAAGEVELCTETATNRGAAPIADLTLEHLLASLDTGALLEQRASGATLPPGGSLTAARSVATAGLAPGGYACLLRARVGGEEVELGGAGFQVAPPPVSVRGTLELGSRGRLLALLDGPRDGGGDPAPADDGLEAEGEGLRPVPPEGGPGRGRDPGGPPGAPSLAAQADFLARLLQDHGWSATLTASRGDFRRELEGGGYDTLLLLAERQGLRRWGSAEVREAVHLGAGLVVAGGGRRPLHHAEALLGLRLVGDDEDGWGHGRGPGHGHRCRFGGEVEDEDEPRHGEARRHGPGHGGEGRRGHRHEEDPAPATALRLLDAALLPEPEVPLLLPEPHPLLDLATAEPLAAFLAPGAEVERGPVAIAGHGYGRGRTLVADLDLLAEATAAGPGSPAAALLAAALDRVAPAPEVVPGGVVPVTVGLTNQGVATPVAVELELPPGVAVVDAGGATVEADGRLRYTLDLAEGAEAAATLWLRLPEAGGPLHLEAAITAGQPPAAYDQGRVALDLTLPPPPTLEEALSRLEPLARGHRRPRGYRRAREALRRAGRLLARGRPAAARRALLRATGDLAPIPDPEAEAIRTLLDRLLFLAPLRAAPGVEEEEDGREGRRGARSRSRQRGTIGAQYDGG